MDISYNTLLWVPVVVGVIYLALPTFKKVFNKLIDFIKILQNFFVGGRVLAEIFVPEGQSPQVIYRQRMISIISIIVLLAALFIVISGNYGESEQKWAYGAIGTILGFWFKNE